MTSVSIDTWFGDAQAVALEDTRFLLCVPTDFKRDVIRSRYPPRDPKGPAGAVFL